MAATDMAKAGYEDGCLVNILTADQVTGSFSVGETNRLAAEAARNPWAFQGSVPDRPMHFLLLSTDGSMIERIEHYSVVERDYKDCQQARQDRFDALLDRFPGDAGVPEESDTIERFCCVQVNDGGDSSYGFLFGDTFEAAVLHAGGEVLDGWNPEGVYDLDTGAKIDAAVSSPVITRSEDQGATVNVLAGEEEGESYMDRHPEEYDHIADTVTITATVPPGTGEVFSRALSAIARCHKAEDVNGTIEQIRQLKTSA